MRGWSGAPHSKQVGGQWPRLLEMWTTRKERWGGAVGAGTCEGEPVVWNPLWEPGEALPTGS